MVLSYKYRSIDIYKSLSRYVDTYSVSIKRKFQDNIFYLSVGSVITVSHLHQNNSEKTRKLKFQSVQCSEMPWVSPVVSQLSFAHTTGRDISSFLHSGSVILKQIVKNLEI